MRRLKMTGKTYTSNPAYARVLTPVIFMFINHVQGRDRGEREREREREREMPMLL
jgi:hypothetical protein